MRYLPFFVYGTLLPGQPNYDLWSEDIADQVPAIFPDGRLFDLGAYPMLLEGEGSPVTGQMITIKHSEYAQVLLRLDTLEGYDPENPEASDYRRYNRVIHLVDGRALKAWVYLGKRSAVADAALIESGDWVAHMSDKSEEIFDWWTLYRIGKTE
jgi:gamma-glutamylcyclotransferase (GGCT)/AIG2-like uncharacterized protein YtfP